LISAAAPLQLVHWHAQEVVAPEICSIAKVQVPSKALTHDNFSVRAPLVYRQTYTTLATTAYVKLSCVYTTADDCEPHTDESIDEHWTYWSAQAP